MNTYVSYAVSLAVGMLICASAEARGFGGARGGGFGSFGGGGFGGYRGDGFSSYRAGGFGDYRAGGFAGADRGLSYSGSRSGSLYSGFGGTAARGSYDRTWSGSRGGSLDVEGTRGAAVGPRGGAVAGGQRDVTATGPEGRTYSGSRDAGVAVGPYGRMVGGGRGSATASGFRGTASAGRQSAFAGGRFPTDLGLAHYSSFAATGAHSTANWSHGYMTAHAGYVRTGFGYYNCLHPGWYAAHPGCWFVAGWAANEAWRTATWASVAAFCGMAAVADAGIGDDSPPEYDYGNNVVYLDDNVYANGDQVATASQYAEQATSLAEQGQQAQPPPTAEWKALGVFALVQGDQRTSNNIFQLAINKDGTIRGNYYDGLMDSTTQVYGSVDKKSKRAAWTIGKKTDRVFEAGIVNLTKDETPILVHIGKDKTQQMLLVRMEQPKGAGGQ